MALKALTMGGRKPATLVVPEMGVAGTCAGAAPAEALTSAVFFCGGLFCV